MLNFVKNRIKKITKLAEDSLVNTVLKNKDIQNTMLDLNKEQLYEQGVDADGVTTGTYAKYTIEEKQKNGQRTDHVTLKDTGDFYGSMRVKVGNAQATITGDMEKPGQDLAEKWPKALGLTNESKEIIREVAKPIIIKEVRKRIAG